MVLAVCWALLSCTHSLHSLLSEWLYAEDGYYKLQMVRMVMSFPNHVRQ